MSKGGRSKSFRSKKKEEQRRTPVRQKVSLYFESATKIRIINTGTSNIWKKKNFKSLIGTVPVQCP